MLPKRVLIFSLTYSPFIGGAEIAVDEITKRIAHADMHFDLVTMRADSSLPAIETINNVTVYRVGPGKHGISLSELAVFPWYLIKVLYVPLAALKARSLSKSRPYDAYWSIMTNMVFPVAILRMLFNDRTPHIITLQDGDTVEHITQRGRIRLFVGVMKKAFARATVVQAISHFLADLAKPLGFVGAPVVIPNGVGYEHFSNKQWKQDPLGLVYRFDKKPNDVFLITTSRLVDKNAVDDIVRAVALLPERIKLLVVGEGPNAEALWDLVVELGIEKRVRFIGHVVYKDIPAYLAISDIFIRPSLSEGMGNSFVEAMAAGIPVIGTPVGGIVDFLFDPQSPQGSIAPTGLFCRVRNPQSIADAVNRLTEDPKLVRTLTKNAREMAHDVYDWDIVADRMHKEVFRPTFES